MTKIAIAIMLLTSVALGKATQPNDKSRQVALEWLSQFPEDVGKCLLEAAANRLSGIEQSEKYIRDMQTQLRTVQDKDQRRQLGESIRDEKKKLSEAKTNYTPEWLPILFVPGPSVGAGRLESFRFVESRGANLALVEFKAGVYALVEGVQKDAHYTEQRIGATGIYRIAEIRKDAMGDVPVLKPVDVTGAPWKEIAETLISERKGK